MAFASLRLHTVRVVVSTDTQTAADAMKLAHDGGVEAGYLQPTETGMRFHPAFLNPGTTFAVAYADDEPIASLVSVEDGPFGVPSDRAFVEEIDAFRSSGDGIFEAAAWVITRDWRRHTMVLGAMLFGSLMRLKLATTSLWRMIVVVEPHRSRMVAGIFPNELISEPRPYLALPGTLLVTQRSSEWANGFLHPDASTPRSIVAERVFDPDPQWLQVGLDGPDWTEVLLPALLQESRADERIRAQLELMQGYQAAKVTRRAAAVSV